MWSNTDGEYGVQFFVESRQDEPRMDTPEKNLLVAIVERAVSDLRCKNDRRIRQDALDWLTAPYRDDPEIFSFQDICMSLEIDYDQVQSRLAKVVTSFPAF
jgi:hypothetical protein